MPPYITYIASSPIGCSLDDVAVFMHYPHVCVAYILLSIVMVASVHFENGRGLSCTELHPVIINIPSHFVFILLFTPALLLVQIVLVVSFLFQVFD